MNRYIIFGFWLLITTSCAQQLTIKNGLQIDRLGINVGYNDSVPTEMKESFKKNTRDYILRHNADRSSKLKLFQTKNTDSTDFEIIVNKFRFVSPKQNALATALNIIGLVAVPLTLASSGVDFIIGFWLIPETQSSFTLVLSDKLAIVKRVNIVQSNSGYLRNYTKQVEKHGYKFQQILKYQIERIESKVAHN
jgi:hypothetical protein